MVVALQTGHEISLLQYATNLTLVIDVRGHLHHCERVERGVEDDAMEKRLEIKYGK